MTAGSTGEGAHGLDPKELAAGEHVLHHWPAPGGIGLVTDRRCLLLGHPKPLHRPIRWTAPLDEVHYVEVQQGRDTVGPDASVATSPIETKGSEVGGWSGVMTMASLPGDFMVVVDGTPVFRGYPKRADEVQGWIERARIDCVRRRREPLGAPSPLPSHDAREP